MKYFQIPSAIQLVDKLAPDVKGESVTFFKLAISYWLNSNRWETPKSNLAKLVKVVAQLEKAPLEWAALEDAEWDILADIIRNPDAQNGSPRPNAPPPLVMIQLVAFDEAVLNAVSDKPGGV